MAKFLFKVQKVKYKEKENKNKKENKTETMQNIYKIATETKTK